MPTYNMQGWVWSGLGSATTLLPVTITDDDAQLSPFYTNDFTETLTINGNTYVNIRAGTYELTFTDTGGTSHTEDMLLFHNGTNFFFVPMPGSSFDSGSTPTALGGWQSFTTDIDWVDVTCFCTGTLIGTAHGRRPIDSISVGDSIETPSGFADAIWIGRRSINATELAQNAKLRPVRIMAGALGNGLPMRDLLVSRQHRMLVCSKIVERMFGCDEVLIPAIKLVALPGVFVDETVEQVEYFHLLFTRHEVIFAEGAPTESLFTGPEALKSVSAAAREEILMLFPEITKLDYAPTPARPIPTGKHQKQLVERHRKNEKPLVSG